MEKIRQNQNEISALPRIFIKGGIVIAAAFLLAFLLNHAMQTFQTMR